MRIDMEGEEDFGPVKAWLYSNLASSYSDELYKFAARGILQTKAVLILDVGTGPGTLPIFLAKSAAGKRRLSLYAVDPSVHMLGIARKRSKGLNINFERGYSLNVPFKKKFDMIVSSLSFHHWAHRKESLRYLSRLLVRKGEIRIYEYKKQEHRILRFIKEKHSMSAEELRSAADGTGLRVKRITESNGMLCAIYAKA